MIKQVIILRKDLNMRKGKMVAQGAHASLQAFMTAKQFPASSEAVNAKEWFDGQQTKICVGVQNEIELRSVYRSAMDAGLPCSLILDAAHTEFPEPTWTAVAIGPAEAEEIDKITGTLKLL